MDGEAKGTHEDERLGPMRERPFRPASPQEQEHGHTGTDRGVKIMWERASPIPGYRPHAAAPTAPRPAAMQAPLLQVEGRLGNGCAPENPNEKAGATAPAGDVPKASALATR